MKLPTMIKKLSYFYYAILIALFLSIIMSCDGSRRLNRLLNKYPDLRKTEIVRIDTVLVATSPRVEIDTFLSVEITDTAIFEKGQLRVEIWRYKDTLFLDAECDTVTMLVPFETEIEVEKIIYRKPLDRSSIILFILICLVIVYFIIRAARK